MLLLALGPAQVWNPCFDVTPGEMIEGIITEEGVVPRDSASGRHKVADFMAQRAQRLPEANGVSGVQNGVAAKGTATGSSNHQHHPSLTNVGTCFCTMDPAIEHDSTGQSQVWCLAAAEPRVVAV